MNREKLREKLEDIYGTEAAESQLARYCQLRSRFEEEFKEGEPWFFRAPGRTEIGGNHTDHQNGQVLAAAIDLDIAAAAAPAGNGTVLILSEGFGRIETDLFRPYTDDEKLAEKGTASALVRGVAEEMKRRGYRVGGFRAYMISDIPQGAGLSSSAAFEILIGAVLNGLFNGGIVPPEEIARMAQKAENDYYGKPCGLMDQMASAMGGLCHIDFSDPESPSVEKLNVNFHRLGYCLCITNTHGSHAEHTEDYAAVRTDLANAAGVFGKELLEGVSTKEVIDRVGEIREAGGDRAFLRAMHVAAENDRVIRETAALKEGNISAFLNLVRLSGDSSYKLLQNVHVERVPERQELAVALAVSEAILENGDRGVCRVHGGGFAGTIQAFVAEQYANQYREAMDNVFGEGSCSVIRICRDGGMTVLSPDAPR